MTRIVIVGVGGVGRYHLLGLAKESEFSVQAVDRSDDAIAQAEALLVHSAVASRVTFLRDISECWRDPDLTIVATQAGGRAALTELLLAHGHRTFVLEKLVCQRESDYERLMAAAGAARARVWVVAPLRYNQFYQELEPEVRGAVLALQVAGADLGLATNVIHFADLFARLRGTSDIRLDGAMIAPDLVPNKRGSELAEFGGTLIGRDSSGSLLSVANLPFAQATQTIAITSEQFWCLVDVPGGSAYVARRDDQWRVKRTPYAESYVSVVTPQAAKDIVRDGKCRFPTLAEMLPIHRELFRIFRAHLAAVRGAAPDVLPIT